MQGNNVTPLHPPDEESSPGHGFLLERARQLLGMSQVEAARLWGVTRQAYAKWETNGAPQVYREQTDALDKLIATFTVALRSDVIAARLRDRLPFLGDLSIYEWLCHNGFKQTRDLLKRLDGESHRRFPQYRDGYHDTETLAALGFRVTADDDKWKFTQAHRAFAQKIPTPTLPDGFSITFPWEMDQSASARHEGGHYTFVLVIEGPHVKHAAARVNLPLDEQVLKTPETRAAIYKAVVRAVAEIRAENFVIA